MDAVSTISGRAPDWRVTLENGRALHLKIESGEATVKDIATGHLLSAMMHPDYLGVSTWKEACHALARLGYTFSRKMTVKEGIA